MFSIRSTLICFSFLQSVTLAAGRLSHRHQYEEVARPSLSLNSQVLPYLDDTPALITNGKALPTSSNDVDINPRGTLDLAEILAVSALNLLPIPDKSNIIISISRPQPVPQALKDVANITCVEPTEGNPSPAWSADGGDQALQQLHSFFDGDLLVCAACYGKTIAQCPPNTEECNQGLATSSEGRFDTAAGTFFKYEDLLVCGVEEADCLTRPRECSALPNPGGFVVMFSMVDLNNQIQSIWDVIGQASAACTTYMDAFNQAFSPAPASPDLVSPVLEALVGGVFGLMGTIFPATAAADAVMGGVASLISPISAVVAGATPSSPDAGSVLYALTNATQQIYATWSDEMFAKGRFGLPSTSDAPKYQEIDSVFENGAMLVTPGVNFQDQQRTIEKSLLIQLALHTWNNSQNLQPIIAYDNFPCGQGTSYLTGVVEGKMPDLASSAVTIGHQCYYLLGVTPTSSVDIARYQSITEHFCGVQNLPGGVHTVLTGGDAPPFAGLTVDDFVIGAVNGWNAHKKTNGYAGLGNPSTTLKLPTTVQDPGVVTSIPICDYTNWKDPNMSAGINCPDIRNQNCAVAAKDVSSQPLAALFPDASNPRPIAPFPVHTKPAPSSSTPIAAVGGGGEGGKTKLSRRRKMRSGLHA